MTMNSNDESRAPNSLKEFYASRKEAGKKIDPETAVVACFYGYVADPYNVEDLPEEYRCYGKSYFAMSPGSGIWVAFQDLPSETTEALWRNISAGKYNRDEDELPF